MACSRSCFILPATLFLKPPPKPRAGAGAPRIGARAAQRHRVAGLHPNVAQALICVAGFCCCIPMSMPAAHIVAFCGDIGIKPTHGAAMLSVMLGSAFLARQAWGALADRIGGLRTVLAGSACQAVAIACFLLTQDEAGLFAVSAAFGLASAASSRPTASPSAISSRPRKRRGACRSPCSRR